MVSTVSSSPTPGEVTFGRYRIEPPGGDQLCSGEIAQAAPNYLAEEMRQRVARAPVRFNVRVQIPEPGDTIDDPSMAWPDQRKTLGIGVLEITAVVPDSEARNARYSFCPPHCRWTSSRLIRCSRRGAAYPVWSARRHP